MDNYTINLDVAAGDERPLDYRAIKLQPTLFVNEQSGEIEAEHTPDKLEFKQCEDNKQDVHRKIRPVAPFLEVFAVTDADDTLVPLTVDLLKENGAGVEDISWNVRVANRKVARRTADNDDVVHAEVKIRDHDAHALHGICANFVAGGYVDFGRVRFIKPNAKFPGNPSAFHAGERLDLRSGIGRKPVACKCAELRTYPASAKPDFLARYRIPKECAVYDDRKTRVGIGKASAIRIARARRS